MKHYRVRATHKDNVSIADLDAENSLDATMQAIAMVLDRAMMDDTWKLGEIVLLDGNGRVLHRMEAKG